jgi:hypothetical protein
MFDSLDDLLFCNAPLATPPPRPLDLQSIHQAPFTFCRQIAVADKSLSQQTSELEHLHRVQPAVAHGAAHSATFNGGPAEHNRQLHTVQRTVQRLTADQQNTTLPSALATEAAEHNPTVSTSNRSSRRQGDLTSEYNTIWLPAVASFDSNQRCNFDTSQGLQFIPLCHQGCHVKHKPYGGTTKH